MTSPTGWPELTNPRDGGARWCAAHLLARSGHTAALVTAMRTEPSRENLRAMALAISGADTTDHVSEETCTVTDKHDRTPTAGQRYPMHVVDIHDGELITTLTTRRRRTPHPRRPRRRR